MIYHDLQQLHQLRRQHETLALVPTMGALHEGHLSLVRLAKQRADHVVVSIFVNPTQFAPGEDYEQYPRDLEADAAAVQALGADVFAPPVSLMYPDFPLQAQVTINPGEAASILEGKTRPTHFAGVCQVVAKLFNLVRPDVAVFGQKDAQQLTIIKQMVKDLSYPIEIVSAPIVRDDTGLALSSRNQYLSSGQRREALALSQALAGGQPLLEQGKLADAADAAWKVLNDNAAVQPDYAAVVDAQGFFPLALRGHGEAASDVDADQALTEQSGTAYLLVAAKVGGTRLIDNVYCTYPTRKA